MLKISEGEKPIQAEDSKIKRGSIDLIREVQGINGGGNQTERDGGETVAGEN